MTRRTGRRRYDVRGKERTGLRGLTTRELVGRSVSRGGPGPPQTGQVEETVDGPSSTDDSVPGNQRTGQEPVGREPHPTPGEVEVLPDKGSDWVGVH